ncbi:probable DNA helicase MCM9 isoform X1 [Macadamia integrifolia]|uniref:probable DNA helicase MCM9 isoform X1 n=1 Tax=Macadamia integrifolia TaxID=60698 RepID=UPI001C502115|nr:probable DNA helicase MCM9 isoform X1 [Macadamia integrifolia]XP_042506180.1 probable DNA helicase MCM9 isoform X1 [Macadamia integrifolia]XP_042506181.1 probable DNA helicase MCM9 isoform X1 [Macadamia integrifolia]
MEISDSELVESFKHFLLRYHCEDIRSIVLSQDPMLHYPLHIDFAELTQDNPPLSHLLFSQPTHFLPLFDKAAYLVQKDVFVDLKGWDDASVKEFVHVRINISGSPLEFPETFPSIGRVRVKHRGILLTLKGTVIRSGSVKMIEGERKYMCRKCKFRFDVHPELESGNAIRLPSACPSKGARSCEGTSFEFIEGSIVCHDYQEIKIQESTQVLGVGSIPRSITVVLKDDLVDLVKAGDNVIVTGVLTAKWSSDLKDVRCDLDPILVANHVRRTNELKSEIDIPDDVVKKFKQFWTEFRDTPLKGRNAILRGICPQVFGLFTVKLAVSLTLIGGVQHVDASGTKVRGESHLLLVGDPGTGKSQFLKFAAKLSNRSVITTGLGSTAAGLTVTAVKDGGEWMLEAGALVLADGGLCCIDEVDSMREHDRATIHEAMEQQTISIAKAGLVTTLSTRTVVFGATNPKGQYDPSQPLSVNTTLSGPLLSRFDIVLVLLDTKNPEWDAIVSSHILAEQEPDRGKSDDDLTNIWPLPMLRRYIHFVKRHFKPVLTKDAERVISSYYQLQRRSATENAARTTVRMLESLIRLAQAHARLMFRNEVTRLDAIAAILCIESSMTTSAIVDTAGNALHSNFTENPDQEYARQEKLILEKLKSIDEFPDITSMEESICR